ncbi:glycerophosphodiester phosphodiesterase family protein [Kocuria sp.]|uniref:glycerophosphodiester phosphodiesterase family protein n=1 Tax=Kocuria sp. TaxID=1871328 RepID=UPI0028117F15|nr:glycerophosphodiester phosphodiesterase family protein [Kocuria sp.]
MPHVPHVPPPHDPVGCSGMHSAPVFRSPDELAAATRHARLGRTGPLMVASRAGFHPDGPWPGSALESAENVRAALPATIVEIDLRATVDGVCVVLHDAVMGRASTGAGPISDQSADYVLSQRLVDNHGEVSEHRLRAAGDFLAWAVRTGAVLWLDVHDVAPETVVGLVREHGAESQVIVGAYGLRNLSAYRRLAPDLVYFVPTHADGLPTVEDVRREVPDPERLVGFAGEYMPDPEDSVRLRTWDVPAMLDLTRYDENLHDDELDLRCYRRAVEVGCRILRTTHVREVAELLQLTAAAPQSLREHYRVSRR